MAAFSNPEQDFLEKLGSRIKSLRVDKNISLNQFSKLHGFEKASLSRLESGKTNVTVITLLKLSQALNKPIDQFFAD